MKLLTIYSFIVWLLWNSEIWFLVYLEFVGFCQCQLLSFLHAGKVDLVAIVMDIYGLLFLIVWCGVFGKKEIVDVLKTVSILCLISSYYFLEPYWTGYQCGENNPFLQFWILLDLCNFCIWSVHHCILPVYLGVFFFISINLYYLSIIIIIIIIIVGGLSSRPPIRYCPLWKWRWALVLNDLFNLTSRRDASHSCLISLWPKA